MQHREELQELLVRAGLTVVEDVRPGRLFPPEAGWRIARGIGAPDGAGREALDAAWWHRLRDVDGEFLVAVIGHRIGGNDSRWTRVRYAGGGVPGLTGDPGFVALSLDGQVLLSEVPGADGPRVTALDRLPDRLEEAAAAAGRETEAERAEVWAAVPGRLAWPLHWAERIGSNPAAPDELLIQMLDVDEGFLRGCDRPAVLDAAVAHPDPRVRSTPADAFRPKLTSDQWVRLVRAEPALRRRVLWAERACVWGAGLPADLYDDLLAGSSRTQAAELPGLPAHHPPGPAADADPQARAAACGRWEDLAAPLRKRLLADTDDTVRTAALLAHHAGAPMPREVFVALPAQRRALERCRLDPELEAELVRDGDAEVRRALAANPGLGAHGIAVLAKDPHNDIRSEMALRPDLTEEQRAAVRHDFDPNAMSHTLSWVADMHGDADAMRRLAASSHPLIRRSVARAKHLPPDVAEHLARDEDRAVRLFLAESCDDAPADLLLEVWRWWDGSFSHPDRPRSHPNFPRAGLLRYADDSSGQMRRLALDDPESTPADVARLARDPEAEVRRRAAEDPRLSPADAVRLVNDPAAHVRDTAVRNPQLPARVIAGLLHDRDTASAAVTNPAIPVPVLHRILTRAAVAVAALR
uniref:PE-PGRS family protein n=1 Tax=Streptomyces sp. NBC_00003 TaxID=2903608 RepID=A0AAU2VF32_9ACTN